jgi:pSer/pThr/pTyr-binding forkhead associated (FHA) protein
MLERFPAGWSVTDLGSSKGAWVNGEPIWASRRVRHGDEIRVGQTRLVFRDAPGAGGAVTEAEDDPPYLTTRKGDVLVALCRPLLNRDILTEPASTRTIADELVITQAAVKQHLANPLTSSTSRRATPTAVCGSPMRPYDVAPSP